MSSVVLFHSTDSTGYTSDIIATPYDDSADDASCRGANNALLNFEFSNCRGADNALLNFEFSNGR
jgi:hypothetical protein